MSRWGRWPLIVAVAEHRRMLLGLHLCNEDEQAPATRPSSVQVAWRVSLIFPASRQLLLLVVVLHTM